MSEWFDIGAYVEAAAAPGRGLQYGDGLFETIAVRQGEPRRLLLEPVEAKPKPATQLEEAGKDPVPPGAPRE